MQTEVTKKRFTVEEYYKMGEVGTLSPEVRTDGDSLFLIRVPSSGTDKTSLKFQQDNSISCLPFPDTQFSAQELLA